MSSSPLLPDLFLAASTGNKSTLKKLIDSQPIRMLEKKDKFGRTPLILCVVYNHIDCVSLLLKAGVQVDNDDNAGQTALHAAVIKGFNRCVKLLVSYNASWQHRDFDGVTPLHFASINPNYKCLSSILKKVKPGEIDLQDNTKKTALHWCAGRSCLEHMKMLLSKDAHICIPDKEGKTPLHWAVISQEPKALECAKLLLQKENSLINWQDYEGRSALHLAIATSSNEIVHYLISKKNCNIDVLDNAFCTPLHWAARRGMGEKVNMLLNRRASSSSADGSGASPLHYAAYNNHAKTVAVFLSRRFIHDTGDLEGRNALMWAAATNAVDVITYMASHGEKLTYCDKTGATALHVATILNNASTVINLLKYGTPVDIEDENHMTPLLKACEWGRTNAAQILLDYGANLHATDIYKHSTLHWCALGGHANLCQVLLLKGANSNAIDEFGRVPLHYASRFNNNINCVSVLLESGADPDISDLEGKTPLHSAVLNDRLGVVRLLCEHDADVNAMAQINDWATPLDFAISDKNKKMVSLLESFGGYKASQIKEHAASVIQKWYLTLRRKIEKWNSNKLTLRREVKSVQFLREKSSAVFVPDHNRIASPKAFGENNRGKYQSLENEASIVIQNAWRRYSMKNKFQRMQSQIKAFFESETARKNAEKQWKEKLADFYKELYS